MEHYDSWNGYFYFQTSCSGATVAVAVEVARGGSLHPPRMGHGTLAQTSSAGGQQKTAPAPQLQYHPNYYATWVLDPDGHDVEVVNKTGQID